MLSRYVAGAATPEERRMVQSWVEEEPGRSALVAEMAEAVSLAGRPIPYRDPAPAWTRLKEHMQDIEPALPNRRADRKPVRSARRRVFSPGAGVAAVLAFMAIVVFMAVRAGWIVPPAPGPDPLAVVKTFETSRGERATIQLTDGSHVVLNAGSRLTVLPGFDERLREVKLEGEAFFQVASDPDHPFRVVMGETAVQVLGTEFSVRNYDQEETRIVVTGGRVAVELHREARRDTVLLMKGGLARVGRREGIQVQRNVDTTPFTAWASGRLIFRDASFDDVARELERWYDLDIEVQAPITAIRRFNGQFSDQSLSEILNIVSSTLHLRYERNRRSIQFYAEDTPRP